MRAEFSENLITRNELIDSQHRELIDRINKLLDSCEEHSKIFHIFQFSSPYFTS